jgi:hypothetical protein
MPAKKAPAKEENKDDQAIEENANTTLEQAEQAQKLLETLSLFGGRKSQKMEEHSPDKPHAFWDHQPVPKLSKYNYKGQKKGSK